jgi:hypothetical protein
MQLSMFFALTSVRCFASVATDSLNILPQPKRFVNDFFAFSKKNFRLFSESFFGFVPPFFNAKKPVRDVKRPSFDRPAQLYRIPLKKSSDFDNVFEKVLGLLF